MNADRFTVMISVFISVFLWHYPAGDGPVQRSRNRRLLITRLEDRVNPVAPGLVAVGAQPIGGLTGKIAYIHAGHGITADNLGNGSWATQRGEGFEMVEDYGNHDQMTFLADYLFRAGATVVPLRPVGHQVNEVVLDNDDAGVTFSGSWSNSSSSIYFGSAGDVPYRSATSALTETAYARYRPNIAQAGFYPVYSWTLSGSNRATDQLYRVNHAGGITEVKVNHRRVGGGLVYLGTYYFNAGTDGYVDISNRSSVAGSAIIADMIRFGNGMGDIDRGGGVSGRPREDEPALYWIKWHVDRSQGIADTEYRTNSDDRDATVSASPRYAEYMNRQQDGALSDRVFVSFHSNGGTGTSRGTIGLYNGNNDVNSMTPNQFLLAKSLGQEVNDDMVAQNGQYEHDWFNKGTSTTLDRSDIEFGEINNYYINNEFDATIVEVAYHDNQLDAELMRDAKVRDAVARATYQGLIKYFRGVDGNTTPATTLPTAVTGVRAESNAAGSVTLSWLAPASNSYLGDAATGYRIYASVDGYAFDGGTAAATTSATLTGLDPNTPYYFKVVATNAGGESPASEVLAVLPKGGPKQVLIVNGFDRLGRSQNPKQPYGTAPNTIDRVRPRFSNSGDYAVQVGSAIFAAKPGVRFNSTSNEAVISGAVNLADYKAVIWISGEESTADSSFDATEQAKVEAFIAGGGHFFASGAEIGWDLDAQNNGHPFYENTLKSNYVSDDANTYSVNGSAGGIFAGLSFAFDNGTLFYDSEYPDTMSAQPGAQIAMTYATGGNPGAAIQSAGTGGRGNVVNLGFPFETITSSANRNAVMLRVLDYFNVNAAPPPKVLGVAVQDGSSAQRSVIRHLTVTFDSVVTLGSTAFQLSRTGPTGPTGNVSLTVDTTASSPTQTIAKLTWPAFSTLTEYSSLIDGTYTLTITAAQVSSPGGSLDGNGNGVGGDDFATPTSGSNRLYRLFGDANGDGFTDNLDFLAFRAANGSSSPQLSYDPAFDFNGEGLIDLTDFIAFRSRMGMGV